MSSPCQHDVRLGVHVHGGGALQASFEGKHLNIDGELCISCGQIRLIAKNVAILKAFLEESSAGRKQT